MLPLLLGLPERLVPDEGDEDDVALRGTFIASPLEDDEASWLLPRSLLLPLWVQPAPVLPAAAAAPAAVALAMAPSPSKHPSNSEVARMAIKPPKAYSLAARSSQKRALDASAPHRRGRLP